MIDITLRKIACALEGIAYSTPPVSSSELGYSVSTKISVTRLPVSIIALPLSDSHSATCCGFPTVADKPIL